MGKSLGMSSKGLDFDRFMRALVQVPKDVIDKALKKRKKAVAGAVAKDGLASGDSRHKRD
jgi:hypothetical protein